MVSKKAMASLLLVYMVSMLAEQTEGFVPFFTQSDFRKMQVTRGMSCSGRSPEKHREGFFLSLFPSPVYTIVYIHRLYTSPSSAPSVRTEHIRVAVPPHSKVVGDGREHFQDLRLKKSLDSFT